MRKTFLLVSVFMLGAAVGFAIALYEYAPYQCRIDGNPFTCDDRLELAVPLGAERGGNTQASDRVVGRGDESRKNLRVLDGIALLGAFEGQEFLLCNPDEPETCRIEAPSSRCALEISGSAAAVYSKFLEGHGLASEEAAAIRMVGVGVHIPDGLHGHMGANFCKIEFHSIKFIELTADPFSPPPPAV